MEVKKTPKTTFPQPLEAIVNSIEVVETMEMSEEDIDVETKEETNGTSKYDEFKRQKEFIVRCKWKVSLDTCKLVEIVI